MNNKQIENMFNILGCADNQKDDINITLTEFSGEWYIEIYDTSAEGIELNINISQEKSIYKVIEQYFEKDFINESLMGFVSLLKDSRTFFDYKIYNKMLNKMPELERNRFEKFLLEICKIKIKNISKITGEKYTVSNFKLSSKEEESLALQGIVNFGTLKNCMMVVV